MIEDKFRHTVVVVANLLLVLSLGMLNYFRNEVEQNVFEELKRENHLRPIVTLLHDVQHIT
jgi:hypothetical protein